MNCRHCHTPLEHIFLDLGSTPPSNAYLTPAQLRAPETSFPLRLFVCHNCFLVQTEDHACASEIFSSDYAYFSSISRTWLAHAHTFCSMIRQRLNLGAKSHVLEIAANDGYLLRDFVVAGIPCLGV